jgi:isoleucyl-tRNA synthetase
MSKSIGNGMDPKTVTDGGSDQKREPAYGADLLRWWIAGCDYTVDVPVSQDLLSSSFEQFRKVRNSGRFMLGNLGDFDLEKDGVAKKNMCNIDQFMLHRVAIMAADVDLAYSCYNFMQVQQQLLAFINGYLNSFYIEIVKDRLYLEAADGIPRRSAQTALHHILDILARAAAPVACHLAEELHAFRRGVDPAEKSGLRSIVLGGWPATSQWIDPKLAGEWEDIKLIRRAIFGVVEDARKAGLVATAADSVVTVGGPPGSE